MAPRRQIAACLALATAGALMLGCGSSGDPSISSADADSLLAKLDAIQTDVTQGDCTGSHTAQTRLVALQDQVDSSEGINDQARSDLAELLDGLDAQIAEECQTVAATSTSSSTSSTEDSSSTDSSSTDSSSTDSSDTTSSSTTTTETETTDSSTTQTQQPPEQPAPEPPPSTPPGQGGGSGGGESGGVGPGFESGREVQK
jgi:hypothetical protein